MDNESKMRGYVATDRHICRPACEDSNNERRRDLDISESLVVQNSLSGGHEEAEMLVICESVGSFFSRSYQGYYWLSTSRWKL